MVKGTRIPQKEMDALSSEHKKERRAEQKRRWNEKNKDKVLLMRKQNIKRTKVERDKQIKEYRARNPLIYFTRNTITRIATEKAKEAMSNLPYTQDEFMAHIESMFLDGMDWSNRKEWHIDHVKPLVSFAKDGVFDLNIINALSNLQPLWAKDNLEKSAK